VAGALRQVRSFTADGLLAPYDPGGKTGTHCELIAGVSNGQWVRIEPSSGFDCSGTYVNLPLSELK
jgi:hypothetical protein